MQADQKVISLRPGGGGGNRGHFLGPRFDSGPYSGGSPIINSATSDLQTLRPHGGSSIFSSFVKVFSLRIWLLTTIYPICILRVSLLAVLCLGQQICILRVSLLAVLCLDKLMGELHDEGKTVEEIADYLKTAPLHLVIIFSIKTAYSLGCDLRIVSDANIFYIQTILKYHGLMEYLSEINTNPGFVDENGRLRITPYLDFHSSPHGCNLCPPNMCKRRRDSFIWVREPGIIALL